jgi:hypothetical protein
MGRDKEMTGPEYRWVETEWFIKLGDVNWGSPATAERLRRDTASIVAKKQGNTCGAKGSRKVNE